jgi:CubicO group peptidase (beta-lactamase class C family)
MRNTYFYDDHTKPHPAGPLAIGYSLKEGGAFEPALYPSFEQVGDGGLYSTVNDVLAWDQNFYRPRVGDQSFLQLIQTPGKLNDGKPLDYAFALQIRDYGGLETVVHSGAFMGYRTIIQRFPSERWSVVILCNLYTMAPETLALRVADIYLADALDRTQAQYAGEYVSTELGTTWRIAARGGLLVVAPERGLEVRLTSQGNDRYGHAGGLGPATLTFHRENGQVRGFSIDAGRARGIEFVRR